MVAGDYEVIMIGAEQASSADGGATGIIGWEVSVILLFGGV